MDPDECADDERLRLFLDCFGSGVLGFLSFGVSDRRACGRDLSGLGEWARFLFGGVLEEAGLRLGVLERLVLGLSEDGRRPLVLLLVVGDFDGVLFLLLVTSGESFRALSDGLECLGFVLTGDSDLFLRLFSGDFERFLRFSIGD